MSVLPIVMWPDPRLTTVCDPVDGDVSGLIADMFDTMYAAPGRGLAAPQVGVLSRVFVIDVTWKEGTRSPRVFINPELIATQGVPDVGTEACLSIPGLDMQVARPRRVQMRWTDETGATHEAWLEGNEAICAQHELDHLNGRVIFDHQSPDLRAALEAEYAP